MKITAEQLYKILVTDYALVGQKGKISFTLKDITVEIETKDTIGNLIQEWLKAWMIAQSLEFGQLIGAFSCIKWASIMDAVLN